MHIDGTNLILGRVASFAAKQALLGEQVIITNCEKIVISGNRAATITRYQRIYELGNTMNGPYQPRVTDRFVKRVCKRMLPHKRARGRAALRRIRCYAGNPGVEEKAMTLPKADKQKLPTLKTMTVGELCFALGGRR
ncbi:50S ribosomal protein L13 [Candidatus Woesearchaeota archaeon]|nr:50S ribosomal protein L13 [Candidatus Woesearchaeota archaeon]